MWQIISRNILYRLLTDIIHKAETTVTDDKTRTYEKHQNTRKNHSTWSVRLVRPELADRLKNFLKIIEP